MDLKYHAARKSSVFQQRYFPYHIVYRVNTSRAHFTVPLAYPILSIGSDNKPPVMPQFQPRARRQDQVHRLVTPRHRAGDRVSHHYQLFRWRWPSQHSPPRTSPKWSLNLMLCCQWERPSGRKQSKPCSLPWRKTGSTSPDWGTAAHCTDPGGCWQRSIAGPPDTP